MNDRAGWADRVVADCLIPTSFRSKRQIQTREYKAEGLFPIIDQGQQAIAGWTDDESAVIDAPLPVVVFGDHSRTLKYVDFPFARGADGTQVMVPREGVEPLFFYYACKFIDVPARGYNRHFGQLKESSFPCPSDSSLQRLVARVLRSIEAAVGHQTDSLRAAVKLRDAAAQWVFSNGLRRERIKDTAIGSMPMTWEPIAIPELCDIQSGGTPAKSNPKNWSGDVPWVSGKDLKRPSLDDTTDHVNRQAAESGSKLVPKGTVLLLVRGMGLANDLPVAVINREMAFNQDIKALVPKKEFSGAFIRSAIYAGKERLLSQIVPSAHGTMTLNLNDVENFQVACPADPDEATEIAQILGSLDAKIELHRKKRRVLEELFKALLHKLMTGEIDVNDLDLSALQPGT
jgi:type I restriction enzyme S subunit